MGGGGTNNTPKRGVALGFSGGYVGGGGDPLSHPGIPTDSSQTGLQVNHLGGSNTWDQYRRGEGIKNTPKLGEALGLSDGYMGGIL